MDKHVRYVYARTTTRTVVCSDVGHMLTTKNKNKAENQYQIAARIDTNTSTIKPYFLIHIHNFPFIKDKI